MRRLSIRLALLALLAAISGLWLTAPRTVEESEFAGLTPDPANGEIVFAASGCASCHSAPQAEGEERLILAGGRGFASDFGTFFAPNISPGKEGVGDWSLVDLANALRHGTSPDGRHYYPAFPYTTYSRMTAQDIVDLFAYIRTLPADETPDRPHDIGFPFNIRASLGGWKLLFADSEWVAPATTPEIERGRYIVEAMGHCAECHTPRNALGATDRGKWLHGAANPAGSGSIPPLTPDKLGWTQFDIVAYLNSGFTPEFDTAGGEMAEVVKNTRLLPESDLEAIAAYLLALPPADS